MGIDSELRAGVDSWLGLMVTKALLPTAVQRNSGGLKPVELWCLQPLVHPCMRAADAYALRSSGAVVACALRCTG